MRDETEISTKRKSELMSPSAQKFQYQWGLETLTQTTVLLHRVLETLGSKGFII